MTGSQDSELERLIDPNLRQLACSPLDQRWQSLDRQQLRLPAFGVMSPLDFDHSVPAGGWEPEVEEQPHSEDSDSKGLGSLDLVRSGLAGRGAVEVQARLRPVVVGSAAADSAVADCPH